MNCRTCGQDTHTEIPSRDVLWAHFNNAMTELHRHLNSNNVIQAYFQWEQIYYYSALLKNTEESQ